MQKIEGKKPAHTPKSRLKLAIKQRTSGGTAGRASKALAALLCCSGLRWRAQLAVLFDSAFKDLCCHMASFGHYRSLGFGDPHGDGLCVLDAAGATSFAELSLLARINRGWRRQVNARRSKLQHLSLRGIDFDRLELPRDADETAYNGRVWDLHSAAEAAMRRGPDNWCFGFADRSRDRRVVMGAHNADLAMGLILRFYSGLETLDMRSICVSAELLLRLPIECPLLKHLDVRGSPAGELYEN